MYQNGYAQYLKIKLNMESSLIKNVAEAQKKSRDLSISLMQSEGHHFNQVNSSNNPNDSSGLLSQNLSRNDSRLDNSTSEIRRQTAHYSGEMRFT